MLTLSAALIAANLAWIGDDLGTIGASVVGRDAEAERWTRWVAHHERLFAMLHEGARIGIQVEGELGVGIIVERAPSGIGARRALHLASEEPGVVLTVAPDTAEALLRSVDGDPEAIWQTMKELAAEQRVVVRVIGETSDLDALHAGGYLAFMRAIDVRPRDVDWPTIRARLGER